MNPHHPAAQSFGQIELEHRVDGGNIKLADEPEHIHKLYATEPGKESFANNCLLARRLVERGVRFVQLYDWGWDSHGAGANEALNVGFIDKCKQIDQPMSALLIDLEQRGLSDKVLLIITGDFGRTPKINARGGRDHWANLCTLALAGGGLNMGQVIGQSGRKNDAPTSEPIAPADLMATVAHTLFDVGTLRLAGGIPRDVMSLIENGRPIAELF